MGQKVHPKSIRLTIVSNWLSNWFAGDKDYARFVKEDHQIRTFLHKKLKAAAISRVEVDRKAQKLILRIITGRPGIVVGRGGQGLDQLRKELAKLLGTQDIQLDVLEVDKIDAEAQLIAESIAQQMERRVSFRRALKQAVQRAQRAGVQGIKISIAGRLGGAEIARREDIKDGKIPLHTFRANIDYGVAEALTVFGIIGVKVWVFKGEVLPGEKPEANIKSRVGGGRGGRGGGAGGGRGPGRDRGDNPRGGAGGRGKRRDNDPPANKPAATEAPKADKPAVETKPAAEPATDKPAEKTADGE